LEVTTGGQQLVMHADAHGIRIVGPMLQQKQNIAPARAAQSSKDKHRMDEDSLDAVYAALIEEPVRSMGEQNSGEPSTTCTSTSESSPDDSHDRKNNLSRLTWKELDRQVLRLYKKGRALIEAMPKE
jgi:protein required for attachment to host cells